MEESCHAIHLNEILDVLLLIKTIASDLVLSMVIKVPSTPILAPCCKAAAKGLNAGESGVETVTRVKFLLLLNPCA